MALGKRIKALRESKGLSQEALSKLTNGNVSQGAISALEKRDSESSRYTSSLAAALGVSTAELHGTIEEYLTPKLKQLLRVAQDLPDYAIDEVIRDAIKTNELITKARMDTKNNGTHK